MPLIVDNTLASPYLVKPFEHGADIVVHSATKFLGGHGNSIGGADRRRRHLRLARRQALPGCCRQPSARLRAAWCSARRSAISPSRSPARVLGLRDLGPALSPFNAFLILTGIETLPLRMQRHCDNALEVATFLSRHPAVSRGQLRRASPKAIPTTRWRSAIAQRVPARCSRSALKGRLRGGRRARVKRLQAVLASRECRRHALARDPPSLDDPSAIRPTSRSIVRGRRA